MKFENFCIKNISEILKTELTINQFWKFRLIIKTKINFEF